MTIRLINSLHQLGANAEPPPASGLVDLVELLISRPLDGPGMPAPLLALAQDYDIRRPELRFVGGSILGVEADQAGPLHALDIGCGALPIAAWLSRRGHVATAVDVATSELRSLVRSRFDGRPNTHANYVVGRAEQLPFASSRFSLVTLLALLHDLRPGSDRVALWEAARVLQPGGHLILTVELAPPGAAQRSQQAGVRRAGQPYPPEAVEQLLGSTRELFDVPRRILPEELETLTWDELDASIAEAFAGGQALRPGKRSVTLGAVLQRRPTRLSVSSAVMLSTVLGVQAAQSADQPGRSTGDALRVDGTIEPLSSADRDSSMQELRTRVAVLEGERRRLERIAEARFRVIRRQEQTLDAYRRRHWRARLRQLTAPKIGTLFQHDPIPLQIPPHYSDRPALADVPRVSIVTPTLNQGRFIERTIRSLVEQEYPALEYIVQDGGSTDGTLDILDRYRDALSSVASERDAGFGDAINRGFARSSGDIMAYLNSDDILLPGALHQVAHVFLTRPEVDVVYGHRVIIDEHDREVGRWVLPPHDDEILTWVDYIPQETLFWRRSIWDKAGGRIDDRFKFAIDWDLLLRFRDVGARFERLPRFLGAFRVHPHQKTSSEIDEVGVREMAQLRQRCHGRPVSLAEVQRRQAGYLRRHVLLHKLYRLGLLKY